VLVGGGAKLPDFSEMVKDTLGLPTQIGFPLNLNGMTERVDDPEFATVCGLAKLGLKATKKSFGLGKFGISSMTVSIGDWFKSFTRK
jgi:cell division protein FtsA